MGQGPEVGLFPEHAAPPSESGARAHMDPQGGARPTWVARPFWVPRLTGVLWPGCVGHSHGPPRRAAMEEVVIAGMSGKLPESENLQEFWDNLIGGVDMVTDDDRRWKAGLYGLPRRSGKLKDLSRFDASFFGVHPKQAHTMDPQLRLLLEVTYEAIVDAGGSGIRDCCAEGSCCPCGIGSALSVLGSGRTRCRHHLRSLAVPLANGLREVWATG